MSSWPLPFEAFSEDPKTQREPMAGFGCWKRGLVWEAGCWGPHHPVTLDLSVFPGVV